MKEYIGAFSSDYRDLYKADIYKVLALPDDFIIHFRYKFKYVEQSIIDNPKRFIGKDVVIFHSINNTTTSVAQNISVRKATLINAENSEDTGLFHAYLKLSSFCNITINATTNIIQSPPTKFFSTVNCDELQTGNKWFEKINEFKGYFPDHCFYQIKSIETKKGRKKNVKITKDKKGSYFCLNHGKKYLAKLSIANPASNDCKLDFKSSSDDITANMLNPIPVSAQFDDITVPLYLKSLNVSTESSFITFTPINDVKINSEYSLNIEIEKKISLGCSIVFGIFTLTAVMSIWILKDGAEAIKHFGNWDWNVDWWVLGSCISLLISTIILFSQFNKK
jgi:hypothetical protein